MGFTIGHYRDVFTGRSVLLRLVICGREPVALYVGLHPKIGEEEEEEKAIHPDQVDPQGHLVVALLHEIILADVDGDQNKLRLKREGKKPMAVKNFPGGGYHNSDGSSSSR